MTPGFSLKARQRVFSGGLAGSLLGSAAATGVSYLALRSAGTRQPFHGALIFGAGALGMGLLWSWWVSRSLQTAEGAPNPITERPAYETWLLDGINKFAFVQTAAITAV